MRVRVVTDSTALLPPGLAAELRIAVVPLTIVWEAHTYHDGIDLTYADFAARAGSGVTPKTSAPSPGEYRETYERALQEADGLVVITPPAELSATFSNATLAAGAVAPDRIAVLDSRSAAAGQGLVALEAARAAAGGGNLEEVTARAGLVASRVRLVATLERLDYLRRSGRVPAVAAYANDALGLDPLFRFVQGKPTPIGVTRGGRRAADRIVAEFARSREEGRAHVAVMHGSRLEHALDLRERILAEAPGAEVFVVECTAAMAAHLGPGLLGIAWWWEPPGPAGRT